MKITGSTATYHLSKDYSLHVGVQDTPLGKCLTIDSQWLGAKDPDALQRQFTVTLPANTLKRIGLHLLDEAGRNA